MRLFCSCEGRDNVQRQRADEQAGAEARAADQPRVPRLGHDRGRQRVRPRHAVRLRAHQGRPGRETVRQEAFEFVNFDINIFRKQLLHNLAETVYCDYLFCLSL